MSRENLMRRVDDLRIVRAKGGYELQKVLSNGYETLFKDYNFLRVNEQFEKYKAAMNG